MKLVKKVIFILLLFSQTANAFDVKTGAKIYDKLFYAVFQKDSILVYAKDPLYKSVILNSQNLKLANSAEEASIIIISSQDEVTNKTKNKLLFATDNDIFIDNENAIGAFYWQKGRPEIVFSKARLKNAKLSITQEFERYLK